MFLPQRFRDSIPELNQKHLRCQQLIAQRVLTNEDLSILSIDIGIDKYRLQAEGKPEAKAIGPSSPREREPKKGPSDQI